MGKPPEPGLTVRRDEHNFIGGPLGGAETPNLGFVGSIPTPPAN